MYTYQVVGLADCNDRTYECEYGTYNKKDGFVFNNENETMLKHFEYLGEGIETVVSNIIDDLFHKDMWKIVKPEARKMSIADIEKELGYPVQITDPELDKPEEKKEKLSKEQKEDIDDFIDVLRRWFGIEMDR